MIVLYQVPSQFGHLMYLVVLLANRMTFLGIDLQVVRLASLVECIHQGSGVCKVHILVDQTMDNQQSIGPAAIMSA